MYATPCAWFPALAQTKCLMSDRFCIELSAPRSLYDLTGLRSSLFKKIFALFFLERCSFFCSGVGSKTVRIMETALSTFVLKSVFFKLSNA